MATAANRWDPFAELANMRSAMDRIFEQGLGRFSPLRNGDELGAVTLAVDVYETPDSYVIRAPMPGVDPGRVDISIEDDVLTIRAEWLPSPEIKDDQYLRRELPWGSVQRSLRLPATVDSDRAEASFEHGMLTLSIAKKPEARPRIVKVTPKGMIEGTASGQ